MIQRVMNNLEFILHNPHMMQAVVNFLIKLLHIMLDTKSIEHNSQ